MVEKRHDMLKNVLSATPAFLKSVSRLEALLFLMYISLTVHALIEREVRKKMEEQGISSLPLYPEERECRAPTAIRIFEIFSDVRRHLLMKNGRIVQRFLPELSSIQKQILSLLHISPQLFAKSCKSYENLNKLSL
jgi:transposase